MKMRFKKSSYWLGLFTAFYCSSLRVPAAEITVFAAASLTDSLRENAALFEKATQPQQHLWLVQQFYQASRDFRLLAGLADSVIGHTAGRAYPFIQNLQSAFAEIQDEATVDACRRVIDANLNGTPATPSDLHVILNYFR